MNSIKKLTLICLLLSLVNCEFREEKEDQELIQTLLPLVLIGVALSNSISSMSAGTMVCLNLEVTLTVGSDSNRTICNYVRIGSTSPTFTVSPELPAGVSLIARSSNLSLGGIPTTAQARTQYTITAAFGNQKVSQDVNIRINSITASP